MKSKVLEKVRSEFSESAWLQPYIENYERVLVELDRFCLPVRKNVLKEYRKLYEQLFKLVGIGCEPATPPRGWHVGALMRFTYSWGSREAGESLKTCGLVLPDKDYPGHYGFVVFVGYTPPEVYEKYKEVSRIVPREQLVVVSPDPSLFQFPLVSSDPMLFVYVGIDDIKWLRVCSWDISEDLEYIGNETKPATDRGEK